MSKITLKLSEVISLEAEINGLTNQMTGEVLVKGLLSQNLNGARKYWLKKLSDTTGKERKLFEESKAEIDKKYGRELENGQYVIDRFLKNKDGEYDTTKINPDYEKYMSEINVLLDQDVELEYSPIKLSELSDLKGEEFYSIAYKLVEE